MNIHESRPRTWIAAACAITLLALPIGAARAAVPATTAHHFSSHPMISGTVVSVNDHRMVVDTDQGERVTLELDSRTMAPRDLGPGMVLRAEFLALDDCRFYARRVIPVRTGTSTHRTQAYANTLDQPPTVQPAASSAGRGIGHSAGMPSRAGDVEPMPIAHTDPNPGRMMTATPTTAGHRFSGRPMLSGRVVSVNDHLVVLDTDQGQRVGLVMDSRTMVPREVAPGSDLRAEFRQLKDGRYYAKRISRIVGSVAEREQAYAHTRDADLSMVGNPADCGFVSAGSGGSVLAAPARVEPPAPVALVAAQGEPATVAGRLETLPQTASQEPLLLLLGLSALGSAGLVSAARGLRAVIHGLRTAVRGIRIV